MDLSDVIVSNSTKQNWNRLKTNTDERLSSRANKKYSRKRILPQEYFLNLKNISVVQNILDIIDIHDWNITAIVLSLGVNKLKEANIFDKKHVKDSLQEYLNIDLISELLELKLPDDEFDIIGLIYQSILKEGEKNIRGSYYTPFHITYNMTKQFDFSNGQTFFDPCCGSGAYLLSLNTLNPNLIYGMDNDINAVLIAKVNMLLKYRKVEFIPNIIHANFLNSGSLYDTDMMIYDKSFDYIATNPPWGAVSISDNSCPEITSKETFSYFFVKSFKQLKENGIIRFLFPESILNVKAHKDIRYFLLNQGCIKSITSYDTTFTGVTTKYIDIEFSNEKPQSYLLYRTQESSQYVDILSFYETDNLVFNILNESDFKIIKKIKKSGVYYLNNSIWALGIVTGDNKRKLFSRKEDGMECIYTGKEIQQYILKPAKKYIVYNRNNFQQVAKEEIYRAPEKLVYKFISNRLVFSYDNTKSLFLNSANILIPNIPNMTIKTVMAFLNSELFQYFYCKTFGEVKILKGNLMQMPFPKITKEKNIEISNMVDEVLLGNYQYHEKIQKEIYNIFLISKDEINYIRRNI